LFGEVVGSQPSLELQITFLDVDRLDWWGWKHQGILVSKRS